MNGPLLASAFLLAFAARAFAQTEPRPAPPIPESKGLLTRAAFLVTVAGMETEDPRFSLVERSRADVDLAAYRRGRINFFIDTELVMGSERRAFDLNQANIIFETSASYGVGLFDIAGVVHHVSRHVVDREFDRVPAWHTIGPRIERTIVTPNSTTDIMADYGYVVQHTFVDYTWTSQLTLRVDRRVGRVHTSSRPAERDGWESTVPYSAALHRTAAASRVASIFPANARCSISSPRTSGVSTAIPRLANHRRGWSLVSGSSRAEASPIRAPREPFFRAASTRPHSAPAPCRGATLSLCSRTAAAGRWPARTGSPSSARRAPRATG